MAEMRHEWNKMQAERTRERIARDTIKHRDRRIRELETEVKQLREALQVLADIDSNLLAIDPVTWVRRIASGALR